MRLRWSNASLNLRTITGLVLLASVSGIAVGCTTQTGGAATKTTGNAAVAASSSSVRTTAVPVATPSTSAAPSGGTTPTGKAILLYAASQKGKAYCYGGGGIHGPSGATINPPNPGCSKPTVGYDCMSLAQYAVYHGTGGKVALPNNGTELSGVGTFIPPQGSNQAGGLEPGDVVLWGGSVSKYHHSGIYAGISQSGPDQGQPEVWDAFDNNYPVAEHSFAFLEKSYNYEGAYRYSTSSAPPFSITTTSLPNGSLYGVSHKSYTATLHVAAGNPPYAWKLAAGSKPLPPGLELGSTGVISGKATKTGTYPFVVQAVDTKTTSSPSETAKRTLSIKIT